MDKQGSRWIVVAGFVACFLMAMAMGANDVANAFGTSVGAGVVTLRQALVLAAVCNVGGAVLMSGAVTETIRKGIAVLGGLVGAMISRDRGGGRGVRWSDGARVCRYSKKTGRLSCGGVAGVVLQWAVRSAAPAYMALLLGGVAFALAWFVVVQQQFHPHTRGWDPRNANDPSTGDGAEVAARRSSASPGPGARSRSSRSGPARSASRPRRRGRGRWSSRRCRAARQRNRCGATTQRLTDGDGGDDGAAAPRPSAAPTARPRWPRTAPRGPSTRTSRPSSARAGRAPALAASRGANDVANEVAPVAAIWQTWADGEVRSTARTPKWLFLYAGAGVAAGLGLFGARVMRTVGRDATKMTPARGFNIELGYSLASLVASAEGWPVSTTQLCVGAASALASRPATARADAVNAAPRAHLPLLGRDAPRRGPRRRARVPPTRQTPLGVGRGYRS
ncbi:inorganic phosphate transmembrane transporter [Aureococcus anophagefferens]|nr:inorganic phosphate transmembrane transporter [Aureococcus anophagefferens]